MNGEHPTGFGWCRLAQTKMKRRFLRAHAIPQGLCENLINALKLLANQQKCGDSPIQNIFMGLKDKCRERITNGLRSLLHRTIAVQWRWVACVEASGPSKS